MILEGWLTPSLKMNLIQHVAVASAGVAIGVGIAQNTSIVAIVIPWSRIAAIVVSCLIVAFQTSSTIKRGRKFAAFKSHQCEPKPDADPDEHVRYLHERLPLDEIKSRADDFYQLMAMRRSIRFFSDEPVPRSIVEQCVMAAATAPSGAHCQPWHFAIVSNHDIKSKIRAAVEKEEEINYSRRMGTQWVDEVAYLMENLPSADQKPYLTEAPHLIVVFKKKNGITADGEKISVRYPEESVGIASGLLLAALQAANLTTLTSTPLGAEAAIRNLLNLPDYFRVYLLMPVGFPKTTATVPYRPEERKKFSEIASVY